ncbi:YceI family protein [Aquicella lusitana]|uniref:Polyisoprenoid-binding protein YceI n=1 Tax=Aquicella lusitana TaxID=254246 RepID=A0A370GWQ3_9COXI|nr:YceI family protein [Aquicella lusitana]RDI48082.1 polyisoprenoid-binding protein YceI [Aquicella lusitana]VVC72902.1 Protein YceI [Aquicella lusitana]
MKTLITRSLVVFILSWCFMLSAHAAAETYIIDPKHSYVLWRISHFGFSEQTGKWMAEGTLSLDEAKPQNSKVNVTINVNDVITGIPKLDEHLKKEDFFDTAKYPTATFVSNKIRLTGKDKAKIEGTLTLHGVSRPVVLDVNLRKVDVSPVTNKKTAGFSANAKLKRSDFGINAYLPGLGDEVKIDIEVEAYQAK